MSNDKTREVLIALINAVPGREEEFNEWYSTVHIPEIMGLPGFLGAQRYEIAREAQLAPYRYGTIYQIEGSAAEAKAVLFGAELQQSTTFEPDALFFGAFVPLGEPFERQR